MSIKEQVEDARLLAENGRNLGALTMLLIAVAGSSRKVFPPGTKSLKQPKNSMGDREAFTLFLGGRIRKLRNDDPDGAETGTSGMSHSFGGQQYSLEDLLYKFYRNFLVHEGELPQDVEFTGADLSRGPDELSFSITITDKLVLDLGFLRLLDLAVSQAECNAREFGFPVFRLLPKAGVDEERFQAETIQRFNITPGRYEVLKLVLRKIDPESVARADDETLKQLFILPLRGKLLAGALSSRGLADRDGVLNSQGLQFVRHVAAAYELVDVT